MVPMACPSCGRRGSVPDEKINSRLHCKKCNAIFHVDIAGHVVLGEPGRVATKTGGATSGFFTVPGQDSGSHGQAAPGSSAAARASHPTEMPSIWGALPKTVKGVLIGSIALGLFWVLGSFRMFHQEPLPQTLDERIAYVAEAFAYNEPARLRRIATSGTTGDVNTWVKTLRPETLLKARRELGFEVAHFIKILSSGNPEGQTRAMVFLIPPNPKLIDPSDQDAQAKLDEQTRLRTEAFAPGLLPDDSFALPLVWKSEDGQWRLDARASLQAAGNPAVVAETNGASKRAP